MVLGVAALAVPSIAPEAMTPWMNDRRDALSREVSDSASPLAAGWSSCASASPACQVLRSCVTCLPPMLRHCLPPSEDPSTPSYSADALVGVSLFVFEYLPPHRLLGTDYPSLFRVTLVLAPNGCARCAACR